MAKEISLLKKLSDKGVYLKLEAVRTNEDKPLTSTQAKWLKKNQDELIDALIVERNEKKHRFELSGEPLTLDQIRTALDMAKDGNQEMKSYLSRWVNNPTLYQAKVLELLKQEKDHSA